MRPDIIVFVWKLTALPLEHQRKNNNYDVTMQSWQCTMQSWQCSHSEHRFPAPSSKLCQNWSRHWRGTLRASLSGTFLQTLPELVTPLKGHTPSIAFRHLPPNSARTGHATEGAHSEHRFPAPSSKLCQNWSRHWRGTLRASLSGTFLQTLPDLVTPLKGHTPSIAFRHLPPNSARPGHATEGAHSEHRFPAPSSKLCQTWSRHWRGTLRASLSGTFLQTLPDLVTPLKGHTPSIAFRHLPPNSARPGHATEGAHSEHRFPAPSSKLCQTWSRHWRGTLRASLSGTFLQTLPELVTPLKGHTPSIAFRHLPPNSARTGYATEGAHSEHRFPAPSSKLCQNWLRHWRGTDLYLQSAVHRRCQRPPKRLDAK